MNIHQLSVNYLPEQDRILARINTTDSAELRLWFTRRLTLGLAPLLKKIVTEHIAKQEAVKSPHISPAFSADAQTQQMLADFKKQESLQKADFHTPFKDSPAQLPLGTEPLLVTEVSLTPLPNGQLQLVFNEKMPDPATPRGFQLALEANLIHGFVHLLEKALNTSQWAQGATLAMPEISGMLPGEDGQHEKPRYLN
jgi:hypothetical protein